jgi:hypothetical protein
MEASDQLLMKDFALFKNVGDLTEFFDNVDWSSPEIVKRFNEFLPQCTPGYYDKTIALLDSLMGLFKDLLKLQALEGKTSESEREAVFGQIDLSIESTKAMFHDLKLALTAGYFLNTRANRWQDIAVQLAQGKTPDEIFKHLRDPEGYEKEEMKKRLTLVINNSGTP